MSTVTNIVNQLLVEDEQNIINSPDEAYDALQNSDFFEAPSKRLKRTLCKLLNEEEENLTTTLADAFYRFQIAQGRPYTLSRANGRAGKWLEKNSVPERETVFEICFSLQEKLKTVDAVKELITTGFGEHGFNVRSVKECVYFYCFASGKSYADAQHILAEYGKAEIGEYNEGKYRVESGKGDTTLLLRRQLFNNEWDTKEEFMEFLQEDKPLFIEYSKSFVREYEELYNRLSSKIRLFNVGRDLKKVGNANGFFHLVMREAPDALEKNVRLAELYEKFLEAKKDIDVDALEEYYANSQEELFDIWNEVILPQMKEIQKPISANQMELFISQGIPRTKREDRSESYNKGKKRSSALRAKNNHREELNSKITAYEARAKNKDSELYISNSYGVMAHFPQRNDILLPEGLHRRIESLSETNPFESLHYRKLFLLMFYYDYFFTVFCPSDVQSALSQKFDFQAFVREVTETLYRCNLAPLYQNDYFDWLILNSATAVTNGYAPSSTLNKTDDSVDSEVSEVLDLISAHMDDFNPFDSIAQIIHAATDSQIGYLYQCLLGRAMTDSDTAKEELIAAIEDDEDGTVYEELFELVEEEMVTYEDAMTEITNNPLDFFGQVLKMSYGF